VQDCQRVTNKAAQVPLLMGSGASAPRGFRIDVGARRRGSYPGVGRCRLNVDSTPTLAARALTSMALTLAANGTCRREFRRVSRGTCSCERGLGTLRDHAGLVLGDGGKDVDG
jgi:hypothetical protein